VIFQIILPKIDGAGAAPVYDQFTAVPLFLADRGDFAGAGVVVRARATPACGGGLTPDIIPKAALY
jgi:hypothetical protein